MMEDHKSETLRRRGETNKPSITPNIINSNNEPICPKSPATTSDSGFLSKTTTQNGTNSTHGKNLPVNLIPIPSPNKAGQNVEKRVATEPNRTGAEPPHVAKSRSNRDKATTNVNSTSNPPTTSREPRENNQGNPAKIPFHDIIQKVPVTWYRFFIEQHMENMIKKHRARRERLLDLEKDMSAYNTKAEEREQIRSVLYIKESQCLRRQRQKLTTNEFTWIKLLGIGAFGEVALARKNETDEMFAIKKLKKAEIKKKKQTAHVKAERDLLAEANTEWIPKLWYSFQDADHLYFVTEYIPGGDLMSLLIKEEIFNEPMGRFYIAEMILALEYVHKIGYIHRDIKPDNILIDQNGHIKLADFGLCTGFRWTHDSYYYNNDSSWKEMSTVQWEQQVSSAHSGKKTAKNDREGRKTKAHNNQPQMSRIKENEMSDSNNNNTSSDENNDNRPDITLEKDKAEQRMHKKVAHSLVGTPNYIAPEVLRQEGYDQKCDWWSVGVILYEMVIGMPPFYAQTAIETQKRIINWERYLNIPVYPRITRPCKDIINSWICHQKNRLDNFHEIKNHEWFKQGTRIDWINLRHTPAPYKPIISNEYDTRNFDEIPNDPYKNGQIQPSKTNQQNQNHYDLRAAQFDKQGNKITNQNSKDNKNNSSNSNAIIKDEPYFADFTYKRIDMKEVYQESSNIATNIGNRISHGNQKRNLQNLQANLCD